MTMMKAVVFQGPFAVAVKDRPKPQLQTTKDIIVKVMYTALCGSDLHIYRGLEGCEAGTTLGHEFCGTVEAIGEEVTELCVGDCIVSPFTVSCGTCFFCQRGLSSRCTESQVFGGPRLAGAQAQFVRIPLAESTVLKAPQGLELASLVLMGDVFPTGYFAARSALDPLQSHGSVKDSTVVILGCGPVGLSALISVLTVYASANVVAIDCVPDRLARASALGVTALNLDSLGPAALETAIKNATAGRGADVALELVGSSTAIRMAFDLLRPGGTLVSVGVHSKTAQYPWTLGEAYDKNLQLQMGRCPVRSVFSDSLEVFRQALPLLHTAALIGDDNVMSLSQAPVAYDLFHQKRVQKVIFDPSR
ncbi:hypothetical protein ASPCADRAFT_163366 [Aspergillus carbonarius ITEM 5010]|uniref:Enoyl reductase (ER) domain-containing protein n=1 Tax=Aspergillus carbonarius (strain ITEM 5010) TaxID=602072 RepID=A0A1R3RXQ3_ASPC5|nr:hypothetical protein ASPCADRAFT_163366 [Aspergillus carbonarius ITEM 5010]